MRVGKFYTPLCREVTQPQSALQDEAGECTENCRSSNTPAYPSGLDHHISSPLEYTPVSLRWGTDFKGPCTSGPWPGPYPRSTDPEFQLVG